MRSVLLIPTLSFMLASCYREPVRQIPATDPFPYATGTYWKYRITDSILNQQYMVTAIMRNEVNLPGGYSGRLCELLYPSGRDTVYYSFRRDSVLVYDHHFTLTDTYIFPLRVNQGWRNSQLNTDTVYVAEKNRVTVSNAHYDSSYRLQQRKTLPNDYQDRTEWFSPYTGIVYRHIRNLFSLSNTSKNELWELTEFGSPSKPI